MKEYENANLLCWYLIFSIQPGNDGSTNLRSCQCVQSTEGFFYTIGQKIKLWGVFPLSCCSPEYFSYDCLLFYHYLEGDPLTRSRYKYFGNFWICWWCHQWWTRLLGISQFEMWAWWGGDWCQLFQVCVCIFVHTVFECVCACVYRRKFWNRPAFICIYVFKYLYPTNFVREPHPRHCTCKTTEEACH